MNRTIITAGIVGLVVGAIVGFAAGRAAADALWSLDMARHWLRATAYHGRAAAGPVAAILAVVGLAVAAVILVPRH